MSIDGCDEISPGVRESLERELKFLEEHVKHIDREFLYSLLLSQMNNTNRLATIMCDILNIPDAFDLIQQFGSWMMNLREEKNDKVRKVPNEKSTRFANQVRDMFPDVDDKFLEDRCQTLETEEDLALFINDVMFTESYPKRNLGGCVNNLLSPVQDDEVQVIEDFSRSIQFNNSNGEIASPDIMEVESCLRKESTLGVDSFGTTENNMNLKTDSDPSKSVKNEIREQNNIKSSEAFNGKVEIITLDEYGSSTSEVTNGLYDLSAPSTSTGMKGYPGGSFGNNSFSDREDLEVSTTFSNFSAEFAEVAHDEDLTLSMNESAEKWLEMKTTELIKIFPNTDPSYLRSECMKFEGSLDKMNNFILEKLEKNDMPTIADYEKRLEMEELQNRYTKNFCIEDFLKVVPDPWKYFKNSNRNCGKYKCHSFVFLLSAFEKCHSSVISSVLMANNFNLYLSYKKLQKMPVSKRTPWSASGRIRKRPSTIDIQFLQENEEKIRDFIKRKEFEKKRRFEEAKTLGRLFECQCCFENEIMEEDVVYCPNFHSCCKNCVTKYVEVEMGQAKCQFSCLVGCNEKYTLVTLQNVLKSDVFSKIIQAIQMEEIKAAGIEDLVQCPFCSYATIMPPEVKVMTCLNPECQKESCRLCKELSHIPLRCHEVEKSEEVKMRTYIENKMTEALVRTCYKCGKGFVKEEGCNKMVCNCGAKMCYVCRKPVVDYSHFNGQGGTEYHKCPLYSTNDELHVDIVKRVAEEAKAEVLKANPNKTLKHDPTMVLPERTYDRPVVGMNVGAALAVGMLALRQQRQNPNHQGQDLQEQNGQNVDGAQVRRRRNYNRQNRLVRPESRNNRQRSPAARRGCPHRGVSKT